MGFYTESESAFKKAMEILGKFPGKDDPDYATTINNLAGTYRLMGDFQKAEPPYVKSLEICRKIFGKGHPDSLAAANNLLLMYEKMGDENKAQTLRDQMKG